MLGIGDVADNGAGELDAVADRAVRVIEPRRTDRDAVCRRCSTAGGRKSQKSILARNTFGVTGKYGGFRKSSTICAAGRVVLEVSGEEADCAVRLVELAQERQPDDVVEMAVAEEQIEVGDPVRSAASLRAPAAPEPASKTSTFPPQRISTQQVSLPKTQFGPAGAGRLPRAPQIRTRNSGSAMRAGAIGDLPLRRDEFRGRPVEAVGECPGHLDGDLRKLRQEFQEAILVDPQCLQFAAAP